MIVVVTAVAALGVLVMAMFSSTVDTTRWTSTEHDLQRASVAAEGATTLAASRLWSDFEAFLGGQSPRIGDFQAFLDNRGIADSETNASVTPTDLRDVIGLPENADGDVHLDGVEIEQLAVERFDALDSTRLVMTATATARLGSRAGESRDVTDRVQQAFVVEPPDWEGLNYALLANNINCLMCHTQVDNAARFYNKDDSKYGTFRRVKLGSLESIHLRSDPESSFAGSLYLGGQALGEHGETISSWGSMNFKSREFDGDGFLVQDAWGDLHSTNLSPATGATLLPGENLYLDYFANGVDGMVDGVLPEAFPSPFPDDGGYDPVTRAATPELGGNRVVDHNEFMTTVGKSRGSISGGTIGTSPAGATVSTPAELAALTGGNAATLDSLTSGNVYLHGTEDNPIRLNGDIAIDGDLIISGYVEGTGSVNVSGKRLHALRRALRGRIGRRKPDVREQRVGRAERHVRSHPEATSSSAIRTTRPGAAASRPTGTPTEASTS